MLAAFRYLPSSTSIHAPSSTERTFTQNSRSLLLKKQHFQIFSQGRRCGSSAVTAPTGINFGATAGRNHTSRYTKSSTLSVFCPLLQSKRLMTNHSENLSFICAYIQCDPAYLFLQIGAIWPSSTTRWESM